MVMIACRGRYRLMPPTGSTLAKGGEIVEVGNSEKIVLESHYFVIIILVPL